MCHFEFSMSVSVCVCISMCIYIYIYIYAGAVLSAAATGFSTVKVMEWKMHSAALYSTQLHHQRVMYIFNFNVKI